MMNASLAKQSGHAAMLFAMMIPAFFAVFILASDGARALQSKARLQDAAEVAVLAIAARNAENDDNDDAGVNINNQIAKDYIEQYMVDMEPLPQIDIVKKSCEEIPECVADIKSGKPRFFQYNITTKTDHKSWFPNDDGLAGFGEKFTVAGSATARKYQSEAVDVMFVTDFSGSMTKKTGWTGPQIKYLDLIDIMVMVTDELEKFNELTSKTASKNTAGNVTFNINTSTKSNANNDDCAVSQLVWTAASDDYIYKLNYSDHRWSRKQKNRGWSSSSYSNKPTVDYNKTVAQIFNEKTRCSWEQSNHSAYFHDIDLTEEFTAFNKKMKTFRPNNGTASYEGIIRGAQLLKKGKNARRLFVVLSDGIDSPEGQMASTSSALVAKGMCSTISTKLNEGSTAEGKKIKARMAVIGFGYDANANTTLKNCVGAENVFNGVNKDEILNQILELISEEIGHLNY